MKNQLKKDILEKRNSLTKQEILEKSELIKNNLFRNKFYRESKSVMFFVSFNSEVYTHEMIKEALKSKRVIVPKVVEHEIEPSLIIDFDSMVSSGRFGILEPIEAMKVAYDNIDLVVVPGSVFDLNGHRIGFGLGFYDRFLHKVSRSVKIGLAFDFQIVDKIPHEEHDVPVDFIVTDKRIIECKKNNQ